MLEITLISFVVCSILILISLRLWRKYQAVQWQYTVLQVQIAQKEREYNWLKHRHSQDNFSSQDLLFSTLSDAAYDVLLVVDKDRQILAANRHVGKLFKLPEPIGERLPDVAGMEALENLVADALMNEATVLEEQVLIHERTYNIRLRVVREEDQVLIGLALRDITQLVRLHRARRDMVANISHELRTPIANISLIIDGLFHDQDRPRRKDSISSLHAIAQETENLLWLVQEMSDLSMIESGQAIVKLVEEPLHEMVEAAVERLKDQSEARFVTIKPKVPDDLRVLCDRDLLRRVLVNLLHNALKWSPKGKVITVTAEIDNEDVVVSVKDKGPGVPDDQVDRIFERFYQTDESRSGTDGTGLGLAICRHIVGAHGGRIWAEGNSGDGGGVFRFTLLNAAGELEGDSD